MMRTFLANNRDELVARCKAKVAGRPHRGASDAQLANGIPALLEQLQRTLGAEANNDPGASLRISGDSVGLATLSEVGVSAAAHGKQLLELGYSVDQVVHDYGDLCQAITDLAVERDVPFGIGEFRTLNRCLDNAIAGAVTEFSLLRDATVARRQEIMLHERVGFLAHELRNSVMAATLALAALESANLSVSGATGGVLKRALKAMSQLIHAAMADIRIQTTSDTGRELFDVSGLIADAEKSARLYAQASGCGFSAGPVPPGILVRAGRERILAAIANLVQNGFKFTAAGSAVHLTAHVAEGMVQIEVRDHCGGLPAGSVERIFSPFTQRGSDRSGLGLGLSIARQSVELDGGTLTVLDLPGSGCVFTISLPCAEEAAAP